MVSDIANFVELFLAGDTLEDLAWSPRYPCLVNLPVAFCLEAIARLACFSRGGVPTKDNIVIRSALAHRLLRRIHLN